MENAALSVAIIKTAVDGAITIDDRGTIETINPAAHKSFFCPPTLMVADAQ